MGVKHLDIYSDKPTSLEKYSDNKMVIRKIEVVEGQLNDLLNPISVTTNLPTGEKYQYYIHPFTFYSNNPSNRKNETDIPIGIVIHYCQYTELIISKRNGNKITYRLHYTAVEGEPLKVIVSQDLEGYTFSLPPSSKEKILSKFKESRPVRSVFIGFDVKQSFETIHGKIEHHILPALTDLNERQLEELGEIQLINAQTNSIIKSV